MDTDESLSRFLPDSRKTPDLLIEKETTIDIVEFTVSNRYDTADFYKGGGNSPVKYESEARMISVNKGKNCRVHIIACILDQPNSQDVLEQLRNLGGSGDERVFNDFISICNQDRQVISSTQSRSDLTFNLEPLETPLRAYPRPEMSRTIMLPPEVLSSMIENLERLSLQVFHLSSRFTHVCCNYDLSKHKLFATSVLGKHNQRRFGIPVTEFKQNLDTLGIQYLLKVVRFLDRGKTLASRDIKGTVPVTIEGRSDTETVRVNAPLRTIDSIFTANVCFDEEYSLLWEGGFKSFENTNPVYFPPNYYNKLMNHSFDKVLSSTSKKTSGELYFCRRGHCRMHGDFQRKARFLQ